MGIKLDPEEMLEVFGEHDPRRSTPTRREERWGETDAYRESHRRTSAYTKEDWLRLREQAEAVEAELAACLARGSPRTGSARRRPPRRIASTSTRGSTPARTTCRSGLADMYVQDPRFRAHYDDRHAGLADYVHDAIVANALDHIA